MNILRNNKESHNETLPTTHTIPYACNNHEYVQACKRSCTSMSRGHQLLVAFATPF